MLGRKTRLLAVFFIILVIPLFAFAQVGGKSLVLELELVGEKLSYNKAYVLDGFTGSYSPFGEYTIEIISFEDETLFGFKTDLTSSLWENLGGTVEKKKRITLVLPYFKNAEKVVVTDGTGKKLVEAYVGFLAKTCGNNVCEETESSVDCPLDCKKSGKDSYCETSEDGVCDLDCFPKELDKDCIKLAEYDDKIGLEYKLVGRSIQPLTVISPSVFFAILAVIVTIAFVILIILVQKRAA